MSIAISIACGVLSVVAILAYVWAVILARLLATEITQADNAQYDEGYAAGFEDAQAWHEEHYPDPDSEEGENPEKRETRKLQ